jgi:hypothetical protein
MACTTMIVTTSRRGSGWLSYVSRLSRGFLSLLPPHVVLAFVHVDQDQVGRKAECQLAIPRVCDPTGAEAPKHHLRVDIQLAQYAHTSILQTLEIRT